jgi:hypothetical protein
MRLALIGAAAFVAIAFVDSAQAQTAVEDLGYRAQFYSNASGQNQRLGPLTDDSRVGQTRDAMTLQQANEPNRYRYHGGPKSND